VRRCSRWAGHSLRAHQQAPAPSRRSCHFRLVLALPVLSLIGRCGASVRVVALVAAPTMVDVCVYRPSLVRWPLAGRLRGLRVGFGAAPNWWCRPANSVCARTPPPFPPMADSDGDCAIVFAPVAAINGPSSRLAQMLHIPRTAVHSHASHTFPIWGGERCGKSDVHQMFSFYLVDVCFLGSCIPNSSGS
jgi:hypothetical protein